MKINEFLKIGTNIKNARALKGITQKEAARLADIPYSTYSNYENNNREPEMEVLYKIADVLDVSAEQLIYGPAGVLNSETAEYLLELAGYDLYNMDSYYAICETSGDNIKKQIVVNGKAISDFVHDVNKYIQFLVSKMMEETKEVNIFDLKDTQ